MGLPACSGRFRPTIDQESGSSSATPHILPTSPARSVMVATMPEKILVGTDGSPTAARAVDRAVDVAKAAGAPLGILCVGPEEAARRVVESEAARHEGSGVAIEALVAPG